LLYDCKLYSQLLTNRKNKNNDNIYDDHDDESDNNDDDNDIECNNNKNHKSKGLLLIHVCGDDYWLNYVRQQIESTGDFDEYQINTNTNYYHNYNNDNVKDDDNNNIFYKSTILSYTTKMNKSFLL
jgi:hypothetical protein